MTRNVRLYLLSTFMFHVGMFEQVSAKSHTVDSVFKRLEDAEAAIKANREALKEIDELKALLKEQRNVIQESVEKVSRLENTLENLFNGTAGRQQLSRPARKRAVLKIEKIETGLHEQHTSEQRFGDLTEPIAFMAFMKRFHTSDQYPPGAILPFEMTTLNTGNFFNKTSGLFTCPSSGLYKFDWALAYYPPNITHTPTGNVADNWGYKLDVDFVIVYLNRNDTAGVTNPNDDGVFIPYLSKFSGFKI